MQEGNSKLINLKKATEAKENEFHLSMCSGLTMEVIDELCLTPTKAKTLDRIIERVPIWRKEHVKQILEIIYDVTSRESLEWEIQLKYS